MIGMKVRLVCNDVATQTAPSLGADWWLLESPQRTWGAYILWRLQEIRVDRIVLCSPFPYCIGGACSKDGPVYQ